MVAVCFTLINRNSITNADNSSNDFFFPGYPAFTPSAATTDTFGLWSRFQLNRHSRTIQQDRVQITTLNGEGVSVSYFMSLFGFRYIDSNGNPIALPGSGTKFLMDGNTNLRDIHINNFLINQDVIGGPNGITPAKIPGELGILETFAHIFPLEFYASYVKNNAVYMVWHLAQNLIQKIPDLNPFDLELKLQIYMIDINAKGTFNFIPSAEVLTFTTFVSVT